MDDYEHSVQTIDNDWNSFLEECEECNMLPPALAGADSGMSDFDELGSHPSNLGPKTCLRTGISETQHPIDGPPPCEESPDRCYLNKYCSGCLENVLSGSEDDAHLESVNRFFETLKSVTEAEQLIQPSPAAVGKTRVHREEMCSEGRKSRTSGLSTNIPILNPLPASKDRACTEIIKDISSILSQKIYTETERDIDTSTHPNTTFVISDANQSVTVEKDAWKQTLFHGSSSVPIYPGIPLASDRERMSDIDVGKGQHSATTETLCHSSPSSPLRKKRRRRRKRASAEPVESGHGFEMPFLTNQHDSGEELCVWAGKKDLCLSGDYSRVYVNETECDDRQRIASQTVDCSAAVFSTYLEGLQRGVNSNMPLGLTSIEIANGGSPSQTAPQSDGQTLSESSVVTQSLVTGAWSHSPPPSLSLNSTGPKRLSFPKGQTDDILLSTPNDCGIMATYLHPCQALQTEASSELRESPGLSVSVNTHGISKTTLRPEGGDYSREKMSICIGESEPLKQQDITVRNKTIHDSINAVMREQFSPSFESNTLTLPLPVAMIGYEQNRVSRPETVLSEFKNLLDSATVGMPKEVDRGCTKIKPTYQTPGKTNDPQEPICFKGCGVLNETKYDDESEQLSQPNLDLRFKRDSLTKWSVLGETLKLADHSQECPQQSNELSTPLSDCVWQILPESRNSNYVPISPPSGYFNNGASKSSLNLGVVYDKSSVTAITALSNKEMVKENPLDESTTQNASMAQAENISHILAGNAGELKITTFVGQDISQEKLELKDELNDTREDVFITDQTTNSEMVGNAPEVAPSTYTMSSFWKEMEKLTIKDILCLRTDSKAPLNPLSQSPESEAADPSDDANSKFFINSGNSKSDHSIGDEFIISNVGDDPLHNTGTLWECQPGPEIIGAGKSNENVSAPTSVSDTPQPPLSNSSCANRYERNICKNISVQNLRALELEPISHRRESRGLPAVISEERETECDYFIDEHTPRRNSGLDSLTPTSFDKDVSPKSFSFSLSNIFQYFLGSKPSEASPLESNHLSMYYADGNSVPETYDHFFSEFDSMLFSNPLKRASIQSQDELVPIFSCSRSANRNLQFPEVYDHFFQASSSDESCMGSDEEDNEGHIPMRVVTRFSNEANDIEITDIYENFFTDGKLDLFWKNTFSLRKSQVTVSASQRKESICLSVSPIPIRGSFQRAAQATNALGYQDMPFPDPLWYNMHDRIRQQRAPSFRYEDLQISNPRLDTSLLPLKQSDMCLVCIAFASWVLKSANPQVEDAWKAVLLANISALSAIRYLRKYVRKDPNGQKPLPQIPS